jgi:integrase
MGEKQRNGGDDRTLERTQTRGVFRRGKTYVVVYRHHGQQRKKCARTYVEARALHGRLTASITDGTHREVSLLTFEEYARHWLDTYTGRTTRGFRDSTRKGYRFSIEQRAIPFFEGRLLAEIDAPVIKRFIASLFERKVSRRVNGKRRQVPPQVSTVRGHIAALGALLATAVEDGKITHNPAAGVRIARVGDPVVEPDAAELRRALDSDELARFLRALPGEWELFFRLLAMTGIRIGEATELRWKDVDLGAKRLRVRRRYYQGKVAPPKSDNGRRDIPLSAVLARELWTRQGRPEQLIFTNARGGRVDRDWLWKNVLKPAAKQADVPWAGFHTFRHTCASVLFASGKNPKQVQMWLGHSDPGFTLRTYVHLIDDGLGDADFLDAAKCAQPKTAAPAVEMQQAVGAAKRA